MNYLLLLFLFTFIGYVYTYSSGAPDCVFPSTTDMSVGKEGTNGYTLTLNDYSTNNFVSSFGKSQRIKVVLSGADAYAGYLVIAKSGNATKLIFTDLVGSFIPDTNQKNLSCGGITQTKPRADNDATTDTFVWQAPDNPTNDVTFFAIVVKDIDNWYGQSDPISTFLAYNSSAKQFTYISTDNTNTKNLNNSATILFTGISASFLLVLINFLIMQ